MSFPGAKFANCIVKLMLALAFLALSVPCFRYSKVASLRLEAPSEAQKLKGSDGVAMASFFAARFDSDPNFKPSNSDLAAMRSAIATEPLAPKLLSIIGLVYEIRGEKERAFNAMRVAYSLSRHDIISGLYLIERSSASGDLNAGLRYYDSVLSTEPALHGALLPILSSAMAYPEIRLVIKPYLAAERNWVPDFMAVAVEKARVPDLQDLLLPFPKSFAGEEYAPILASALHRIAVEEGRSDALRLAQASLPGFRPESLTSLRFDPQTLDKRLGQFGWSFPFVDGISVKVSDDGALEINTNPLARGAVASRDLLLDAGQTYVLNQRLEFDSQAKKTSFRWSADCITTESTLQFWEQSYSNSMMQQYNRSKFIVPLDCNVVRMKLFVEGADGQFPAVLSIKNLSLTKLN